MVVIRTYKKDTQTETSVQAVGTPIEIMAQFAVIIGAMRTAMIDKTPAPLHEQVNEMFSAVLMDALEKIERGDNEKR